MLLRKKKNLFLSYSQMLLLSTKNEPVKLAWLHVIDQDAFFTQKFEIELTDSSRIGGQLVQYMINRASKLGTH